MNFSHTGEVVLYYSRRLQARIEDQEGSSPVFQTTLRLPVELKLKLDALSSFLDVRRNTLICDLLSVAVQRASDFVREDEQAPVTHVDGKTFDEYYESLLAEWKSTNEVPVTNFDDVEQALESGSLALGKAGA